MLKKPILILAGLLVALAALFQNCAGDSVGGSSNGSSVATPLDTTGLAAANAPKALFVYKNSSALLSVDLNGATAEKIIWKKDGVVIPGASGPILALNNVTEADDGQYHAEITISGATGEILVGSLAFNAIQKNPVAPQILKEPQGQNLAAGQTLQIHVIATGYSYPSFQWQKDGQDIPGATAAVYTVAAASPADTGKYRVLVKNQAGEVVSSEADVAVTSAQSGTASVRACGARAHGEIWTEAQIDYEVPQLCLYGGDGLLLGYDVDREFTCQNGLVLPTGRFTRADSKSAMGSCLMPEKRMGQPNAVAPAQCSDMAVDTYCPTTCTGTTTSDPNATCKWYSEFRRYDAGSGNATNNVRNMGFEVVNLPGDRYPAGVCTGNNNEDGLGCFPATLKAFNEVKLVP